MILIRQSSWNLSGWNSSTDFVGNCDLISVIYANMQNPLCNFAALVFILFKPSFIKMDSAWQRSNIFKYKSWRTTNDGSRSQSISPADL